MMDTPGIATDTSRMALASFEKVFNRLSYGLTPEMDAVPLWDSYKKYEDWVESQLHPQAEPNIATHTSQLNFLYTAPEKIFEDFDDGKGVPKYDMQLLIEQIHRYHLYHSIMSKFQLREVLTDFWFQHFSIDIGKGDPKFVFRHYMDLTRANVFSSFSDLQLALYQTPNMMHFLDNAYSYKYRINENFGREVFELHTVGRHGGYTQKDVIELANILTGWRCDYKSFFFSPDDHKGSTEVVFGYKPQGTMQAQGKDFLAYLANHEKTANFVCTKLASFFISESPSTSLVNDLVKVYLQSSGNLTQVYRKLFLNKDFYDGQFGPKVKRPYYLVASGLRALGSKINRADQLEVWMMNMGERLFRNPDPGGYKDFVHDWLSEDLVLIRAQFIIDLIEGRIEGLSTGPVEKQKAILKLSGPHFQMR